MSSICILDRGGNNTQDAELLLVEDCWESFLLSLIECNGCVHILVIMHHAKKIHGVMDVHLHAFVKLGEKVNFTSRLLHLREKKFPPNLLKVGRGPRHGHDRTEKDNPVPFQQDWNV